MALLFPNRSRSYDETARRVRFVGYDGMMQVPFAVDVDALPKGKSRGGDPEAGHLADFDAARDSVQDVAREAYSGGRKKIYVLTSADFR